jgi:hypothetical protein
MSTQFRSLTDRMIRAARLDPQLYEEVEADRSALPQALLVVVIANICLGLGSALAVLVMPGVADGLRFLWALLWWAVGGILGWFVWSLIVYGIGATIFKGPQTETNYGELLRTIGFSASPGVIAILSLIPFIGWLIRLGVWVWMLVAMVIAVRQALDFSTGRAIGTVIGGFIVMVVLLWVVGAILGLAFIF